jgi:hypothetical protein
MVFLIGIPVVLTAILVYQYLIFLRIYYFGQSLHKLRELRCELTLFLANNVKQNLTLKEAKEYHEFLQGLNVIIQYFDLLKPKFKKFSSVKTVCSNIIFSSEKLFCHSNNTTVLHRYKAKFGDCILTAFKAIPFFRFRVFIFLYRLLVIISIKFGIRKHRKHLNIIERVYNIEKDILEKGVPCK